MSPVIFYHSTLPRHRESIERLGLLPGLPHPAQYFGVYVYNDDFGHATHTKGSFRRAFRCYWAHGDGNDLWQVAYIGPMFEDQFVENGMVLEDTATQVTLVTRNT